MLSAQPLVLLHSRPGQSFAPSSFLGVRTRLSSSAVSVGGGARGTRGTTTFLLGAFSDGISHRPARPASHKRQAAFAHPTSTALLWLERASASRSDGRG